VIDARDDVIFSARPAIDWRELYGNAHPVEIEIGSGKGAFLLAAAAERPEVNFVGVEVQPRWVRWMHTRLAANPLPNVRVVRGDALVLLRHFVPAASVRALHVYFPDPWWKRRHQKRRVVTPELATLAWRALERGGVLHLATDVRERFDAMLADLTREPFAVEIGEDGTRHVPTNFERKYRRQGRPISRATLRKP
jgi:tRNA (guanine-N7-)-methyltransferase